MSFEFPQKILFKHCDPAGIVFYPRYFEMINDCVEAFFEEVVALPFHELHAFGGAPTVETKTTFKAPSRHGDRIVLRLGVVNVGRSSLDLAITALAEGETRFTCDTTLVFVDKNGRPAPWPEAARARLLAAMEGTS